MKLAVMFKNGDMAIDKENCSIEDAHNYLDSAQENIKNGQYVIFDNGKAVYESKDIKAVIVYM